MSGVKDVGGVCVALVQFLMSGMCSAVIIKA